MATVVHQRTGGHHARTAPHIVEGGPLPHRDRGRPAVLALALLTFAWPAARLAPRHLPIGVAGPETAAAPLERQLAESDGAFDVHRYAGASEAREAIQDREVYGAVVAGPQGVTVLTASGASPFVAGLLERAFAALADPAAPGVVDASRRATRRIRAGPPSARWCCRWCSPAS